MKLNTDFSSLHVAAAQMNGLESLVNELRKQRVSYQDGLTTAIEFTKNNQGTVESQRDGITLLCLGGFQVKCFQPYSDIDFFYFEY
ncbi:hypothetical protein M3919_003906 [Vibrio parahaemolyticus]|nr:hypothetical protein [Vibrio parahaemolyticus]